MKIWWKYWSRYFKLQILCFCFIIINVYIHIYYSRSIRDHLIRNLRFFSWKSLFFSLLEQQQLITYTRLQHLLDIYVTTFFEEQKNYFAGNKIQRNTLPNWTRLSNYVFIERSEERSSIESMISFTPKGGR